MTERTELPVDLECIARWMDERSLGSGPIAAARLLEGGTQNILLRFERGGRTYVLRRPPLNKRPNSDETMRREARVLAALAGTTVPHPALIALEPDPAVLGAAFYLMDSVEGTNPRIAVPAVIRASAPAQRELGFAMVDTLLALSSIDLGEKHLDDLGRAKDWLQRQTARWHRQLQSYLEISGYSKIDIPGLAAVAAWLDANRPEKARIGLIHGDFHFGNVLVRDDAPTLAAVVDWELATVGDPRLDLGHMLATWPGATPSAVSIDAPELPNPEDLVSRYAMGGGDVEALTWFRVLACYRLGIILEGTFARAAGGLARRDVGERLHAHTVHLFSLALKLMSGSNL